MCCVACVVWWRIVEGRGNNTNPNVPNAAGCCLPRRPFPAPASSNRGETKLSRLMAG